MSTQNEHDFSIPDSDLINDAEEFATDWLEPWALTDFSDLIDQSTDGVDGIEVYPSKLAELAG